MPIAFDRNFDVPYGRLLSVAPGIRRLLAHNPSPFTFKGTGIYIVGAGPVAVIDPGPDDRTHLAILRSALAGETVSHILLTHTHRDHSPAARYVKQWTGAPTYGFGPHAAALAEQGIDVEEGGDRDFVPDIAVRDGDVLEGGGLLFECVHTPGHTSNHICYGLIRSHALFTGDHVMGWSTSVIAPPDGNMTDYLASLEKLLVRDDTVYWPTHGGPVRDPKRLVREYLAHRSEREAAILAALRAGATRIPDIVARVYVGLDPALEPAAGRSVLAHLIRLEGLGRVRETSAEGQFHLIA